MTGFADDRVGGLRQAAGGAADRAIDFGYPSRTIRTPWSSSRLSLRLIAVVVVLVVVAVAVGTLSMGLGDYPLSVREIFGAVTGRRDDGFARMVVLEWRLPVVLAAIVFGGVLGVGGAIFQSLTRNPLGSPDIIGFDSGAYTAVVMTMLILDARDFRSLAAASLLGGIATALVVYALAYRRGVQGFRLIIVGIGVSAMLGSLNAYLITRADIRDAMTVGFWGAGSIARVTWTSLRPALVVVAVLAVACAALAPSLRRLELGDDAAVTLGTRTGTARLALIVTGVATTAIVTAAAGPIGFIALVAPQMARRITRSPGVSLLGAAAMGAALLSIAYLISRLLARYFRPVPVGIVTVCVGGCYFIWLLVSETRRQYGAPR